MAENTNPEPKKRQVKNPETFREKAIKTNAQNDKPSSARKVGGLFKIIFGPLAKPIKSISKVKFLKPVFKAFRFIGLIVWPKYFRESFKELKKVTWPSFKLSVRLTYAVVAFAIVFGVSIALIDYGLDKVFKNILLK